MDDQSRVTRDFNEAVQLICSAAEKLSQAARPDAENFQSQEFSQPDQHFFVDTAFAIWKNCYEGPDADDDLDGVLCPICGKEARSTGPGTFACDHCHAP